LDKLEIKMLQSKGTKKDINAKGKSSDFIDISHDDIYSNPLKLNPELEAKLKKEGLVARFINAKKLHDNQGYHRAHWTPYNTNCDTIEKSRQEYQNGKDPEGFIRRGDCILAVKKKEDAEKHKVHLQQKADRYKGFDKEKARELRQLAKATKGVVIHEGYDEN